MTYSGDYTDGSSGWNMYVNGSAEGSFTSGGTFIGIEDLIAGSKLLIPTTGDDGYKFNFVRWFDDDMTANIATLYNSGVVPDITGEAFYSNVMSEQPFNNGYVATVGPDAVPVNSPTFDTDLPS